MYHNENKFILIMFRILLIIGIFFICDISCSNIGNGFYKTISLQDRSRNVWILNDIPSIVVSIRGGVVVVDGDDEYDEYEYEEDGQEEDEKEEEELEEGKEICTSENKSSLVISMTQKTLYYMGKLSLKALYAFQRASKAGFENVFLKKDDNEELSISKKVLNIVEAMWNAAMHPDEDDQSNDGNGSTSTSSSSSSSKSNSKGKKTKENNPVNMSHHLSSLYGLKKSETLILGGTLMEALRQSRSKARLLIVFLPSSKPKSKSSSKSLSKSSSSSSSYDKTSIQSLLSDEVRQVCESKKGSYYIWTSEYGSIEGAKAMKMLKPTKVSKQTPILLVAYPSMKKQYNHKILPKVLAQHHCNPPPSPISLASFLKALRKRHAGQIKAMRHWLREMEYQNERQMNYQESMVLDTKRKDKERLEKEEKERQMQQEKERLIILDQRRSHFLESMNDEPEAGTGTGTGTDSVITVAFRLADGRNAQRRFHSNENMDIIFNYVDAHFLWDRECLSVTSMRGDNKISWEESQTMTIAEYAGSTTNMLGLRISMQKEEQSS